MIITVTMNPAIDKTIEIDVLFPGKLNRIQRVEYDVGSIPKGVDNGVYAEIIRIVHAKGAKVLLDADGEGVRKALQAGPDIIKPNRMELEEYAGIAHHLSEQELLCIARKILGQGIGTVAVSMGESGAMMVRKGYEVKCPALSVNAHSTVGAGDAMVAALAYAEESELGDEETVRLCMAASAGAVTTIGTKPPSGELIDRLKEQVIIEEIQ